MSLDNVGNLRLNGIVWNGSWEPSVTGGQFKALIDRVVVVFLLSGKKMNKKFSYFPPTQ